MNSSLRGARRGNRRGRGSSAAFVAAVNRVLHSHHLTDIPQWFLIPTTNDDPLPLANDPVFQRKLRFIFKTAKVGADFAISQIGSSTGLATYFKQVLITRVDIFGEADENTIRINFKDLAGAASPTKVFQDSGTSGSRRSHIAVGYPMKNNRFFPINDASVLFNTRALSIIGDEIDYDFVVDIHCQFYGLPVVPPVGWVIDATDICSSFERL